MEISPQEFRDIQALVRDLCGLVLTDDKTYLVRARLESIVHASGCRHFADYVRLVMQVHSTQMRDELVEALTTGETSFNRDGHLFEEFRRRILPALAADMRVRHESGYVTPLTRFWSAGCSTGQEPYSLAMAILDFLAANPAQSLRPEQFPILATDVSGKSLHVAQEGRYLEREVERGLPLDLRRRYFRQQSGHWIAQESLRRQIDFRRVNLMNPYLVAGPFEVIFCRNVLIYFDAATRTRLCDQFHQRLTPGGYLVLGAAESLYGISTQFESEQLGTTTVYRK